MPAQTQETTETAVRVKYKKENTARYISHLDVIRLIQRALRRAGIEIYHTQGYNPHPHMVFALPLPIFFESVCEVMDMTIIGDITPKEIKEKLSSNLPAGIVVTDVTTPVMKLKEVAFAEYKIALEYDNKKAGELETMINGLIKRDKLEVEKNSKKGIIKVDVREYFDLCEFEFEDEKVLCHVTLPAGPMLNISPVLLITAIKNEALAPDMEHFRRLEIYNASKKPFE